MVSERTPIDGSLAAATAAVVSALGSAAADTGGAVRPVDGVCPPDKVGVALTLVRGQCVELTPPSAHEQQVLKAKNAAADTYASFQAGKATQQQVDDSVAALSTVTGDSVPVPGQRHIVAAASPRGVHQSGGVAPDGVNLNAYYWAFHQINSYYCGPATAQSMLWFLGPLTSTGTDPVTGQQDTLNGGTSHDQSILANSYWLATDANGGTGWGPQYIPFTLNTWRNTTFYVGVATPNQGGTLTSSSAWSDISFDTGTADYPVAENVLYGSTTFHPPGFSGSFYEHWDTLYAHFSSGGTDYISVGQVYGDTDPTYTQFYNEPWSLQWTAIAANNGIVW